MNQIEKRKPKGLEFDMNIGQFLSTIFVLFMVFLLPAYVYTKYSLNPTPSVAGLSTQEGQKLAESNTTNDRFSLTKITKEINQKKFSSLTLVSIVASSALLVLFFVNLRNYYLQVKYLNQIE